MTEGTATPPPITPESPAHPASPGHRPGAATSVTATLVPEAGWHFLHVFYRIDRAALAAIDEPHRKEGRRQLVQAMTREPGQGVDQLQCFAILGHKADFGFMAAGPDLKAIHAIETAIAASAIGPALVPSYSFYSITEISEYVPDAHQYGEVLKREGADPESPTYKTKVAAYEARLGPMNKQRLFPEFADWPCLCFYPMSKMRLADQNWYVLPFETRADMMSQHGKSGMKFAGKVTQVITASTGLDDWEWGVTLWGKNPSYLKDIVYTMRFDESSAKYALFGPFYFGYILPPADLIGAVRL